jgi:uncharacterized protein (TIGR02145 family)
VSSVGDTLVIANNSVIVPGVSAANPQVQANGGMGAQVLVGNNTCTNEYISVTGCGGQTSLTYDGRTYDLVEIGGQCWFADNLATDQYRNGDAIPMGLDNTAWLGTSSGAYCLYNNDLSNALIYGYLYNWHIAVDNRGVCPIGWHVPSDCEWMYLEGSIGMSVQQQESGGARGIQGGALKSLLFWDVSSEIASNATGLSAIPGGFRANDGSYNNLGFDCKFWTSSNYNIHGAWERGLNVGNAVARLYGDKRNGYSIRCLKD